MKNATTVVGACVVLHNTCETFGDHFLEDWECADDNNTEDDRDNATHGRQSGGHSAVAVLTCNHVTHDSINKHMMLQLQSLYATSPLTSFLWG